MRTLPAAMETALTSESYRQCHLIDLDVSDSEMRFTNWTTPILSTDLYIPRGMKIEPMSFSTGSIVEKVRLSIDDVDRALYEALGEQYSGDFSVIIKFAVLDEQSKVLATLTLFNGLIDQWEYRPGSMELTAVSKLFIKWARPTTSRYAASCRWKEFKGTECGYTPPPGETGPLTCNRSYAQCYIPENFGGFRWIPSLIHKKIEA